MISLDIGNGSTVYSDNDDDNFFVPYANMTVYKIHYLEYWRSGHSINTRVLESPVSLIAGLEYDIDIKDEFDPIVPRWLSTYHSDTP